VVQKDKECWMEIFLEAHASWEEAGADPKGGLGELQPPI